MSTPPAGVPRIARRAWVSGRVQGVYYRAWTAERARSLGVTGHARNLDDGRVEVLAVGAPDAVAALLDALAHGPPLAEVHEVAVQIVEPVPDVAGFAKR